MENYINLVDFIGIDIYVLFLNTRNSNRTNGMSNFRLIIGTTKG